MEIAAKLNLLPAVLVRSASLALWWAYISALTPDVAWLSSHHKHPLPAASSFTCYGGDTGASPLQSNDKPEKKPREKWTMEETHMLIAGCNKLRSLPRTVASQSERPQCYPNAITHLSSKVRYALPDGTSILEKMRSKKRRPFTEEEDCALKAGYNKHGTAWATIVKDPIFQAQNCKCTNLRDRLRNASPDYYQAVCYKPRNITIYKARWARVAEEAVQRPRFV
ncbi:hypothetical protein DICSQDRAFT_172230 [Dichomitus squalens LYAD-421 SS1]|uniref:HTH myb-type domain-containing protein n=1 Tax=Dichomitus squalens (strain LYAD-421) TaxID=732165 RepID=R7SWA9_DICSQ|nr:uncharacterized protein DICSQDRAFT_172230 [Dichomitus squalens LYAD-421 SS1]EJF59247.1 hypothetical protein DICSQDRAFT_172230 [Dichomitus squalens LYAD-421 SS1]